jgi:hypothetical protein
VQRDEIQRLQAQMVELKKVNAMNQLKQSGQNLKTSGPSYMPPIIIIVCAVLIGVSTKPIAKMLELLFDLGGGGMGLNARANIEGVLAIAGVIGLIIGIGYLIYTFKLRRTE